MGDFLLDACDPAFCSPTGPGQPFGTWYLALFDSLRLFTVLGALGHMVASVTGTWRLPSSLWSSSAMSHRIV
jgi:hypothetical protein